MIRICLILFSLPFIFSYGCRSESTPEPQQLETKIERSTKISFEEKTAPSTIEFIPRNGQESGNYSILESLGTGVGICDYDLDGKFDILAPGGGQFDEAGTPIGLETGLFRQIGDWKFAGAADVAGLTNESFYSHGVVIGDWNSDGFPDCLITGYHGIVAYENCGDGTFEEITDLLGIHPQAWSTSGAFGDFDNDGFLDLYLVNYVDWRPELNHECIVRGHRDVCPPGQYTATTDQIWWNQKDGTFIESTVDHGVLEGGKGLAVLSGDIDLDGDVDLYVANDTTPNRLYFNNGVGVFEEQGLVSGTSLGMNAEAEGSMGVELADFNQDLIPDLWVSNYENQSFALYQGQAPGIFQHVSDVTGITAVGKVYVGFGTASLDADLDGDEDIFATNGHVMYHARNTEIHQLPLIFENQAGRFENVADQAGDYASSPHMGRGLSVGDFNQDGKPDVVISHTNENISVLQNASITDGHGITVQLIGRDSNRDAIGSVVIARAINQPDIAPKMRFVRGGGSYLSTHAPRLYFGFPAVIKEITLEIRWPSGKVESIHVGRSEFVRYIEKH